MEHVAIPAICVLAHLSLMTIFLPGFWRKIDERGFRWHNALNLFVVPALLVVVIIGYVIANLNTLPNWLVGVSFLAVEAFVLVMVLSAVSLRRRRKGRG